MNTVVIGVIYAVVGFAYYMVGRYQTYEKPVAKAYDALLHVIGWPLLASARVIRTASFMVPSFLYLAIGKVGFEFIEHAWKTSQTLEAKVDQDQRNEMNSRNKAMIQKACDNGHCTAVKLIGIVSILFGLVGAMTSSLIALPITLLRVPLKTISQ